VASQAVCRPAIAVSQPLTNAAVPIEPLLIPAKDLSASQNLVPGTIEPPAGPPSISQGLDPTAALEQATAPATVRDEALGADREPTEGSAATLFSRAVTSRVPFCYVK